MAAKPQRETMGSSTTKAKTTPRRLSWKTASQRRNRPGSCPSSLTADNTLPPQWHPYKALRRSAGAAFPSSSSSIREDTYERNVHATRLRLSASKRGTGKAGASSEEDDEDSLGVDDDDLENLLSGIEGGRDEGNVPATIDIAGVGEAPLCGDGDDEEHDWVSRNPKRARPLMAPVDFESGHVPGREGRSSERTENGVHTSRDDSDILGEKEEDLASGVAAPKQKTMLDTGQGPLGSDDAAMRTSDQSTGAIISTTATSPFHSAVCSTNTHEGFAQPSLETDNDSRNETKQHKIIAPSESLIIQSDNAKPSAPIEPHLASHVSPTVTRRDEQEPHGAYPFIVDKTHPSHGHDATNVFGAANYHLHQADDTISTVTEQTDSPFIFTYAKPMDDDSVSQITSSIVAGSVGSSYLKNIGSGRRQSNQAPSWARGGGVAGRRKRGAVVAGTFGRDKTRHGHGNADPTARSNLDEIAYALNADSGTFRPRRGGKHDFGDLCTIDSEKSGVSRRRSHECCDGKSNVSALGMGGASCGGHSVASASGLSKSSSSGSRGLMEGFRALARRAQHNAGRFFFPTSPKVTQRKKFDRSDSLDDLLLEEGAKTLPRRASLVDGLNNEDDIDYFSRAMSMSSNNCHGARSRALSHGSLRRKPSAIPVFVTIFVILTAFMVYKFFFERGDTTTDSRRGYANIRSPRVPLQNLDGRDDKRLEFGPINDPELDRQIWSQRDQEEVTRNRYSTSSEEVSGSEPDRSRDTSRMPVVFENIADFDAGPFQRGIDVPFYWHVPRSGGGTVNDVLGSCLKLVLASDAGGSGEFGQEKTLRVVHFSRQLSFVNVDAYSPKGIQRAKNLNLITSRLADVVMSPLLHDAAELFTPTHKGRMFTMLRHPIERAASLFYFIQDTQWKEPKTRNDQFADISIENFYKQGLAENNWMTRFLTNELTKSELTDEDLELAKHILKQKFLIGLLEEKAESFERFQKYFGWRLSDDSCIQKKIEWTWPMKHRHVAVEEGSDAWFLIRAQNEYDIQLYDYAKEIFVQQEFLIRG